MSSPVPSPNSEPWARAVPPGTEQLLLVVTPSLCCGLPGSSLPRTQLCPQCPGAGCRGVSGSAPHPRLPLAFLGLVALEAKAEPGAVQSAASVILGSPLKKKNLKLKM